MNPGDPLFWAEVDLDRIARNTARLVGALPRARLLAVVKADGYGHGAVAAARAALAGGAERLGVATCDEAVELRQGGVTAPILVLSGILPAQAPLCTRYDLQVALWDAKAAQALAAAATVSPVRVHVKVDTGMGRFGLLPPEVPAFLRSLAGQPGLQVEGLFTHLATADEPDSAFAGEQLRRFAGLAASLAATGLRPPLLHAANSAAILTRPESHFDMARAGLGLYGLYGSAWVRERAEAAGVHLKPALALKARAMAVRRLPAGASVGYGRTHVLDRETTVITLPLGYGAGVVRLLSHKLQVLARGRRLPVVGRICMNQLMVDGGHLPVEPGEEVVLLGRQGGEEVTADEWARLLGTINYEVVCLAGSRVPRRYRGRAGEERARAG